MRTLGLTRFLLLHSTLFCTLSGALAEPAAPEPSLVNCNYAMPIQKMKELEAAYRRLAREERAQVAEAGKHRKACDEDEKTHVCDYRVRPLLQFQSAFRAATKQEKIKAFRYASALRALKYPQCAESVGNLYRDEHWGHPLATAIEAVRKSCNCR